MRQRQQGLRPPAAQTRLLTQPAEAPTWTACLSTPCRIPGVIASQEVVFGGLGETTSIRHDTFDRQAFMPGMLVPLCEEWLHCPRR